MERSPETRLFRDYWQDGVLDLVAGGAVLLIGLGFLFEQMLAPALVPPLAIPAWLVLHKRVVEPRSGYVQFARQRRRRSTRELVGVLSLGGGLLALVLALGMGAWSPVATLRNGVDAVPAVLVAVAAMVTAGLTRAWRFAAYAAVIAAAGAAAVLLETGPALPLLAGGLIVGGTGAALLARFVADSRRFEQAR